MIAEEQSTETDPASDDIKAAGREGQAKTTTAQLTVHGQTPAEYEWGCLHRGLWERFEGPSVQDYLASLPLFGGDPGPWRLVLGPRGDSADPVRRKALLGRCLKDIEAGAQEAPAATVVLQLLLWPELDAVFWRLLRRAPRYEALGPDLLGCLELAIEQLPHRLEHAAEKGETDPDLGKELTSLTSYLGEQLVKAQRGNRRAADVGASAIPPREGDDGQTDEYLGAGQVIAGLFSPTELARVLDEDHLFRFRVAASTYNGRALLRIVRYPIVREA